MSNVIDMPTKYRMTRGDSLKFPVKFPNPNPNFFGSPFEAELVLTYLRTEGDNIYLQKTMLCYLGGKFLSGETRPVESHPIGQKNVSLGKNKSMDIVSVEDDDIFPDVLEVLVYGSKPEHTNKSLKDIINERMWLRIT